TTDKKIFYSLDSDEMNLEYKKPIEIGYSTTIKAAVFNAENKKLGSIYSQKIKLHKAVGANISLNVQPNKAYNAGGTQALINGISGNNKRYGDSEWLGFSGDDLEITIEFDKPTEINSISTRFHNGNGQWIYAPEEIGFSFLLEDGKTINDIRLIKNRDSLLVNYHYKIEPIKVSKIEIIIKNFGKIPEGKQGAGHKAWTFIDEIVVE
ncbi:MAG: chitobiase/beta-hexosaminidase C-terminal domain-containing protein, partial [Polaribacter sp.]